MTTTTSTHFTINYRLHDTIGNISNAHTHEPNTHNKKRSVRSKPAGPDLGPGPDLCKCVSVFVRVPVGLALRPVDRQQIGRRRRRVYRDWTHVGARVFYRRFVPLFYAQ